MLVGVGVIVATRIVIVSLVIVSITSLQKRSNSTEWKYLIWHSDRSSLIMVSAPTHWAEYRKS